MVVLGAGLLARHLVALPSPVAARLAPAIESLRSPSERGRWLAVHVLYSECRCSKRVVDHIVATPRPPDWSEMVLWVGKVEPSAELTARFDVRRITPADLAAYGVEGAPSLVVVSPDGRVLYAGGYTERKQGPAIEDLRIMASAKKGGTPGALPVFGCAVSDRLKSELALLPTL